MPVTFDFSDATFISKNFSGYLKPKGPEIVYQFQVKEEGKMTIRFYEDTTILYQEFYTSLKIKDASGKIIRETTLSGKESNSCWAYYHGSSNADIWRFLVYLFHEMLHFPHCFWFF